MGGDGRIWPYHVWHAGTLTVLAGSFFYPVCEDIGCDLSTLTLYMTIMTIVLALALPVVGELLTKVKLQFILTAAAIIEISSLVCMSFFTEPWMWYVVGAISGLGLAVTSTVTITPTMGNWFYKRTAWQSEWYGLSKVLTTLSQAQ